MQKPLVLMLVALLVCIFLSIALVAQARVVEEVSAATPATSSALPGSATTASPAVATPTPTSPAQLAPALELSCKASKTSVKKGTEVTYTYSVKNIGTFDIADATLTDPMLSSNPIADGIDLNKNGATQTFTYTTNLEMTTVSIPTLAFSANNTEYSVRGKTRRVVVVYEDLMVVATPDQTIVASGDTVTVTGQVYNNSSETITGISVQDDMGKVVVGSLDLAAGAMHEFSYTVSPQEKRILVFIAKGKDAEGNITGSSSDVITLTVVEQGVVPLALDMQTDVVHLDAAGNVAVTLTLTNGLIDAVLTNVIVTDAQYGTAMRVDTLEPSGTEGNTATQTITYAVSANTPLQFTATAELSDGGSVTAKTQELTITVGEQPTPTPGATAKAASNSTGTLSIVFIVLLILTVITAALLTLLVLYQRRMRKRYHRHSK